jgi:hypothetical protein
MPIAKPPAPAKSSTLCIEKPPDPFDEAILVANLAFPDRQHAPSPSHECTTITLVSNAISFQLWQPESQSRFRQAGEGAPAVAMPETAVDEDHFLSASKHQIRPSSEFTGV